jgi:hypothetical protein
MDSWKRGFFLSLLCMGVVISAGCSADTPHDLTITVFKIDTNGIVEWNSSFVVHATPEYSRAGPITQTHDGSLIFMNKVVRWNSTGKQSYYPLIIDKMDRYGHMDWEYEYPESYYISTYAVNETENATFTIWSQHCDAFVIDQNGTVISKWPTDYNKSCTPPWPSLDGNADSHALDLLGIDRNTTHSVWTLPDGYVSADAKRESNDIRIHLKKYNLLGNLSTEFDLKKTFPFPVGRYPDVALVEHARDGGLIVVGYNWDT